jgi:hypothetical protein
VRVWTGVNRPSGEIIQHCKTSLVFLPLYHIIFDGSNLNPNAYMSSHNVWFGKLG